MKLRSSGRKRGDGEQGLVTLIVLALVVLVAIYLEVNMRVLATLKGEIQLIEESQTVSDPVQAELKP